MQRGITRKYLNLESMPVEDLASLVRTADALIEGGVYSPQEVIVCVARSTLEARLAECAEAAT